MDGLDIVHIHWTQEHPEAPLKMKLLRYGEVPFDGPLKSMSSMVFVAIGICMSDWRL